MHTMIQYTWEILIKNFGKYQFSINGPQAPKYNSNKQSYWESSRSKDDITGPTETLHKVRQESYDEEDELEEHVEKCEILPDSPELLPAGREALRHLDPVHLEVDGPGKADNARHLKAHRENGLDHVEARVTDCLDKNILSPV